MRFIDFSSWSGILTTVAGLVLVTLLAVGIRLIMMMTIQQRQQRMNRQINERLKTLIAAYKVLGGSITGNLAVDGRHLRDLRHADPTEAASAEAEAPGDAELAPLEIADAPNEPPADAGGPGEGPSDRARRTRDSVEAALSDIFLLGTEEHVRLAEKAARSLVAGEPVYTDELVTSLRDFIRKALDLDPIPADMRLPKLGPARSSGSGSGRGGAGGGGGTGGGGGGTGGGGGGTGGMGGGMGMGMGGLGGGRTSPEDS